MLTLRRLRIHFIPSMEFSWENSWCDKLVSLFVVCWDVKSLLSFWACQVPYMMNSSTIGASSRVCVNLFHLFKAYVCKVKTKANPTTGRQSATGYVVIKSLISHTSEGFWIIVSEGEGTGGRMKECWWVTKISDGVGGSPR